MADRSNHKSIGNFRLFDVLQVAINGADRPSTNDVLEQMIKVINPTFDFRKKVSINMELMQSNTVQMARYGIVGSILQLRLTMLPNIKTAAKSDNGLKFHATIHATHTKYAYNHVHDATSLQVILTELAEADGMWVLKDAPTPSPGKAQSVANSVSYLHRMMDSAINLAHTKLAYSVGTDSSRRRSTNPMGTIARSLSILSCTGDVKKRRRTRMTSQKRSLAPTARNSTAGSPIALTQMSVCGTKSTRATASS